MIKAYVAGPFTDERGKEYVQLNIERAKHVADVLRKSGFAVFCPHTNSGNGCEGISEEQYLKEDLEFLKSCDICVIVHDLPGFKKVKDSIGTQKEIEFCKKNNIKIYYSVIDYGDVKIVPNLIPLFSKKLHECLMDYCVKDEDASLLLIEPFD